MLESEAGEGMGMCFLWFWALGPRHWQRQEEWMSLPLSSVSSTARFALERREAAGIQKACFLVCGMQWVTYIVSLGMPLCASFFLSVNELVGLGRWILKRTFLTPVSSTGSYCEGLRYGLRGVTLSGVGTAVHHVAPAPSQSFCCVQASEMVKWPWNNCFLADSGLGGVEWRLRKVCICPKTDKWYVSKSIISRGS